MNVPMMSWNTNLFVMGNILPEYKIPQEIDKEKAKRVFKFIKDFLEKENAVAILQEIPYYSNLTWKFHKVFEDFKEEFKNYQILYYNSGKHIKMTVIITKKENYIYKPKNEITNNRFVHFRVENISLDFLAVHAHDAYDIRNALASTGFHPHIMIGDFNSGNYKKSKNDESISVNRQNYLLLSECYLDLVQGEITTVYNTQIDHILVENSLDLRGKCRFSNVKVNRTMEESDHYPIFFDLDFAI